ncbi:hypothetical protein [uncultured Paraglaciecola sp.]|uniref:hypothetical protein n=1 Tax=uncultured Paraglaciecola sp. TaxID=1765024 RepID=UPI002617E887|nr:hypothetical protein [uncultured Paraglaciecola sp.]
MDIAGEILGSTTKWTDRFAFEVALRVEGSGEPLQDILDKHGFTRRDLKKFNKDPVFVRRVEAYSDDIRENGITFKMKAKAQAEELLTTSWTLIHADSTSPAVKADLIKSTVKWAGLEVKPEADSGASIAGGGVTITIDMGGKTDAPLPMVDITPDNTTQIGDIDG